MENTKENIGMEDNRFDKNKAAIHYISKTRNVDIGTACSMWAHDTHQTDFGPELTAFTRMIAGMDGKAVKAYFEG